MFNFIASIKKALAAVYTDEQLNVLIEETKRFKRRDSNATSHAQKGQLVWIKDKDHKYTYANSYHLEIFYELGTNDIKKVIGYNDIDLIEDFRKRTRKGHTFGELCVSTDELIAKTLKSYRFIELGFKDNKPLYLDVYKSPIIIDGEFQGTKGDAIDISYVGSQIIDLLTYYIMMGYAKRLDKTGSKRIASYQILDELSLQDKYAEFPT